MKIRKFLSVSLCVLLVLSNSISSFSFDDNSKMIDETTETTNNNFIEESSSIKYVGEEPEDEEPADEEPVDEEPEDEKPVVEEPVVEELVNEKPINKEPNEETSTTEETSTEETTDEEIASPSDIDEVIDENEESIKRASLSEFENQNDKKDLFGDSTYECENVETGTGYTSLQDAITWVGNNQTIRMLKDIDTLPYPAGPEPYRCNNGKTFTIDFMQGTTQHKIVTNRTGTIFYVDRSTNVTIKNCKVESTWSNQFASIQNGCTLIAKDCSETNTDGTIFLNEKGTLVVDGGEYFNALGGVFVMHFGMSTTLKGNVIVQTSDAIVRAQSNYFSLDENADIGTVSIEGGEYTSMKNMGSPYEMALVDINGKANVNIKNTTFNNGNWEATLINLNTYGQNSTLSINNVTTDTCRLLYTNNTSLSGYSVTLDGGHYKYSSGQLCIEDIGSGPTANTTILKIKEGYFGPKYTASAAALLELQNCTIPNISTASELDPSDPEYANDYWYIVKGPAPPPPVATILRSGTTEEYLTLQDAIDDVQNGETIVLVDDISYNAAPNINIDNGKTFTINFNDGSTTHVITFVTDTTTGTYDAFNINNNSNVTMNNPNIVVSGSYGGNKTIFKIESGSTLKLVDTQYSSSSTFVNNNGGKVTVSGGTFGNAGVTSIANLIQQLAGEVELTGSIQCYSSQPIVQIYPGNTDATIDAGSVKINGGTYTFSSSGGSLIKLNAKANVTINSANFTNTNANSNAIELDTYGYNSTVTINNIVSESHHFVYSSNNSNLGDLVVNVVNGKYKYDAGWFCKDNNLGESTTTVKITNGYFGPTTEDTDSFDELNANCISGKEVTTLSASNPERANGYCYTISNIAPPPPPPIPPLNPVGGSGGSGGIVIDNVGKPIYDGIGLIVKPGPYTEDIYSNIPLIYANVSALNSTRVNPIWNYDTNKRGFELYNGNARVVNGFCKIYSDNTVNLYYIDMEGYVFAGWCRDINRDWYFFDMSVANYGKGLRNCWKLISNVWYYFDNDCKMLHDTITPDGYLVDSTGAWIG